MNKKLHSLFGLKWNPFVANIPLQGLHRTPVADRFGQRVETYLVREGGFALITGDPGLGKSVTLRLLNQRLSLLPDVTARALTRPQSHLADFYREMGDMFGVPLRPHNRWAGSRALRERWLAHAENTRRKPVLLIDEAQEMTSTVLNELRLLCSAEFDSRILLSVVLAGDNRLIEKLRRDDLLPLESRIRYRLPLAQASREQLRDCLRALIAQAGNPSLMTDSLIDVMSEHALGNYRVLTITAAELLTAAMERNQHQLDESLYLEVCQRQRPAAPKRSRRGSR